MADTTTILDRPSRSADADSTVGWVIAAIIVIALAVGFIALFRSSSVNTGTSGGTPASSVTTPAAQAPAGGAGGSTGGSASAPANGGAAGATH